MRKGKMREGVGGCGNSPRPDFQKGYEAISKALKFIEQASVDIAGIETLVSPSSQVDLIKLQDTIALLRDSVEAQIDGRPKVLKYSSGLILEAGDRFRPGALPDAWDVAYCYLEERCVGLALGEVQNLHSWTGDLLQWHLGENQNDRNPNLHN